MQRLVSQDGHSWWVEALIAFTASTLAVLSVTYPGLLGIASAFLVLIVAAFRVDGLLYLIVFFLPFAPLLNTDLAIRDVSSLLRYGLFAGLALSCVFGKMLPLLALPFSPNWCCSLRIWSWCKNPSAMNPLPKRALRNSLVFAATLVVAHESALFLPALVVAVVAFATFAVYLYTLNRILWPAGREDIVCTI
jgi:hypothetical protein